jgi:hypothetical protein
MAWGCWGGKTGGNPLRSGSGSTNQANAIAEPNERAGITCYLVNGVCHQAANRILFPAGIFVTGARGYGVSELIFGPYGRPRGPLGTCLAPFDQHQGVTGDLPQCLAASPEMIAAEAAPSPESRRYFELVSAAYGDTMSITIESGGRNDAGLVQFMARLFDYKIEHNLGRRPDGPRLGRLRDLRVSAEWSRIKLETGFSERQMKASEFVAESDRQAISLQKDAADILQPSEYQALFDLKHGEFVALADPEIVARAYPE